VQPNKPLNLPPIEERVETLLKLVAEEVRPCRACGVMLAMVRHHNGKLAPYDMQGVNHFILCSSAAEFRRKKESA
jgi:hypothetical protein